VRGRGWYPTSRSDIFFSIDRTEPDHPKHFQGYVHILNMRVTTADPIKQSGGGTEG